MIEEFKNKISKLRTDKNRKQWSGLTNHQAPHKPFLLMSVMDHFAQGAITEPFGQKEEKKIRDQGFRKAIVTLYEHRCAMCGIRMLTPEGHTVVEAAHVVPWSESYDDRPSNGMALCKLCHWSFDEGLMSVGEKYEVKVSKRVNLENNFPGHMLTLSDRSIFKPDEEKFWPGQENLDWHRGKVYFG